MRIVNMWNSLLNQAVEADNGSQFDNRLDKLWEHAEFQLQSSSNALLQEQAMPHPKELANTTQLHSSCSLFIPVSKISTLPTEL